MSTELILSLGKEAEKIQCTPMRLAFSDCCGINQLGQQQTFARKRMSALVSDTHLPKQKATGDKAKTHILS